jgi:hypothetical protein
MSACSCAGGILVSMLQLAFGEFDAQPHTARSAVRQLSSSDAALGTAKQAATQAVDPGVPSPQSQQGSAVFQEAASTHAPDFLRFPDQVAIKNTLMNTSNCNGQCVLLPSTGSSLVLLNWVAPLLRIQDILQQVKTAGDTMAHIRTVYP